MKSAKSKTAHPRTTAGLRDMLFDEIAAMSGPNPDPKRASAVAGLARQIIHVAKAEVDFARATQDTNIMQPAHFGTLQLGSRAGGAKGRATDH